MDSITMSDNDKRGGGTTEGPNTGVVVKARPKTRKPAMYKVLMLNDDYTPMEFVVHVLERFFQKKMNNGKFHVSGADDLGIIQTSTIDTAMCVLAAQNIKEIDKTFAEIARILRRPKKQDTVEWF